MQNKFLQFGLAFIIGSILTACSNNSVVQEKIITPNNAKKHVISNKKITKQKRVKKRVIVKKKKIVTTKKVRPATIVNTSRRQVVTNRKSSRSVTSNNNRRRYPISRVAKKKVYKRYYPQQKPKRRYIARKPSNYNRRYIARKSPEVLRNEAIRKSAHARYFAIKKESQRKYWAKQKQQVAHNRYTPVKRRQVTKRYPAKRYSAKRYSAKRYSGRRYSGRRYSSNRKYSAKRRATVRRITPNFPSASFARALSNAAVARTRSKVRYDGKYVKIRYPWGDVPSNIGVCTDVVIRSYRRLGIDLQKEVHEDMANGGFYDYPRITKWKLSAPDTNIDHRRVYNLQAFFRRHGAQLPITHNPNDYKPGDLVTWMVGPSLPHIGVVVEQRSKVDPRRHMIVHNIAYGPQMEDVLFRFRITGHYRYNKNNRLIAPRRFPRKYAANTITNDYKRLMRELSTPARKPRKRPTPVRRSNLGISDADIRAVLGQ